MLARGAALRRAEDAGAPRGRASAGDVTRRLQSVSMGSVASGTHLPDERARLSHEPGRLPEPVAAQRTGWIGSVAALFVLAAVTTITSLVFWPGLVNLDTVDEMWQAQSGHYADWHTPVLSAGWHVLILVGLRSPGWVLSGGVLMLLVGLYLNLRVRISRPWALLATVLVFIFPPVLSFGVQLGTDAWFVASILCGFGFASRCYRTRGWSRIVSAVLAVACAFVAQAARPTAAPAVFAMFLSVALVILATRLRGWRRLLGPAMIGAAGAALVFGSVLGLQRFVLRAAETHPEQGTYDYDLVAMSIRENQVLLPVGVYPRQDVAYLREFASTPIGIDPNPLWWGAHAAILIPVEGPQLDSLRRAWIAAIRQHPSAYLRERLKGALWQLAITGEPTYVYYGPPPPQYGLSPTFDSAAYRHVMAYVGVGSTGIATGGPLHRVWVYVFFLITAGVAMLRSRRPADSVLALLSAAVLMYSAEILLLAPQATYRFMYPAVVTGTMVFVILVAVAGRWVLVRSRRSLLLSELAVRRTGQAAKS